MKPWIKCPCTNDQGEPTPVSKTPDLKAFPTGRAALDALDRLRTHDHATD